MTHKAPGMKTIMEAYCIIVGVEMQQRVGRYGFAIFGQEVNPLGLIEERHGNGWSAFGV